MTLLDIQLADGDLLFKVKVVPGSSKTALIGPFDRMLKIKIASVAQKGKANAALIAFLAKRLGLKKADIRITAGKTNPVKHLRVSGLSGDELLQSFNLK